MYYLHLTAYFPFCVQCSILHQTRIKHIQVLYIKQLKISLVATLLNKLTYFGETARCSVLFRYVGAFK